MDNIESYEKELTDYIFERAKEVKNIEIYSGKSKKHGAIFSFNVKGLHSHDTAYMLNMKGIAVRSGFHCAQPFIENQLKTNGTARASLYFYNTKEEIDKFIDALKHISERFGR